MGKLIDNYSNKMKGDKMIDFSNKTVISVAEINEFTKNNYRDFLTEKEIIPKNIFVFFDQNIERIDELFYSYLLLFTQDFPRTQIELFFEDRDCPAYQIAFQQIFFINTYIAKCKIRLNKIIPSVRVSDFKEFFPPLLINRDIDWFALDRNIERTGKVVQNDANSRLTIGIQQQCSDLIGNLKSDDIESIINNISVRIYKKKPFLSYILYLYKNLDLFEYYLNEKFDTKRLLKNREAQKIIYDLLNLDKRNVIEAFLFRVLIDKLTTKQKRDIPLLKIITEQVSKTSFALQELAKNILEHTDKGFGVISGRVHKKGTIERLKDSHANFIFEDWITSYGEEEFFLDINVIDSGTVGIRKSYINNLTKLDGHVNVGDEIKEDIRMLEQDDYLFSHFFDYTSIKLLHQIYRANARLGLLIFSEFVLNQKKGLIRVSSTNINNDILTSECIDCSKDKRDTKSNFIELGTNYNFIIPISPKVTALSIREDESLELTPSTSTLIELSKLSKKIVKKSIATKELNKYRKIEVIKNQINAKNDEIILINATEKDCGLQNSSDWIRFLANMQIINSTPIIVYNMDYELYSELININRLFEQTQVGFWNSERNLLFYFKQSYKYNSLERDEQRKLSIWFCSIMSGHKFNNFLSINKKISRYHHNLFSIENWQIEDCVDEPNWIKSPFFSYNRNSIDSNITINDDKLLNFELLIKSDDGLSLFEESAKSLLELEICTLNNNSKSKNNKDSFFHKFKGYKISNAHFRLGSKIHIDDFYYAKRMFYNSFYANRFSFLLATRIKTMLGDEKNKEITLIGYSHYSELVVSNTRRLLNELGYKKINHDVVLDEGKVQKNANNIKENVIVIIPISSTFSTSQKVRRILDEVRAEAPKPTYINNTDINILLIADKLFCSEEVNNFKDIQLFKDFGWDGEMPNYSKRIKVRDSIQEYLLYLPTRWHLIDDCELCFPANSSEEKCLLETGASSITPESIFGFPIIHHQSTDNQKRFDKLSFYRHNDSTIRYYTLHKHLVKDKLHFKQYIRTGSFLYDRHNYIKIIEWLKELRHNKDYRNKNIVIITPSQNAKAGFANLVNQYVFDETATILSYNTTDDTLQNFIYFNSSFFSDAYLIFVDDVIHSAQTFQRINNLIKSVVCSDMLHRRIDKCICLIDRLNFFDRQNLLGDLSKDRAKIHSFIEFNIPPLLSNDYEFPDVVKERLFKDLAEKSVTDIMKVHFLELSKKVSPQNLDNHAKHSLEQTHTKDLFHFLIYHVLFELFEIEEISENIIYKNINIISLLSAGEYDRAMNGILAFINNNPAVASFLSTELGEIYKNEIQTKILYICSTPPFSDYKDIREFAFWGVRQELQKIVNEFNYNETNAKYFQQEIHGCTSNKIEPFVYTKYQTFKLYLRLGVELKMNYIFSRYMLCAIQILLTHWNTGVSRYNMKRKENESLQFEIEYILVKNNKTVSPIGFSTYYTGLIEQIICKDEAKSFYLIKNITDILRDKDKSPDKNYKLRKDFGNIFINLLRKLVLENTFIFNTFHNSIYTDKYIGIEKYTFKNKNFDQFKEEINSRYEKQSIRLRSIQKALKRFDNSDDPDLKEAFYLTMYLKTILKNEFNKDNTEDSIQDKVTTILQYMCRILDIYPEQCNGGAFFTVRYKNINNKQANIEEEDLFKISEYYSGNDTRINRNIASDNSIIFNLYKGVKETGSKKQKSIIELLYDNDKETYCSTNCIDDHDLNLDLTSKIETNGQNRYKNLLFFRISDIINNEKEERFEINPLAVICFYRCRIGKDCMHCSPELPCDKSIKRIDPKRLRLLLLVKEDLLGFIKYQINDGFRAYVESIKANKKISSLSHGVNTFRNMKDHYIEEIAEYANVINQTSIDKPLAALSSSTFKESLKYLNISYSYLINKWDLIDGYAKLKEDKNTIDDITEKYTLNYVVQKIEEIHKYIFNFYHEKYSCKIDDQLIELQYDATVVPLTVEFSFPSSLIDEMIFEIIYNIRKYVVECSDISEYNRLIIKVELNKINNVNYIIISNNNCNLEINEANRINKGLISGNSNNGLNLIWNFLSLFFNRNKDLIFIEIDDVNSIFKVNIPIN